MIAITKETSFFQFVVNGNSSFFDNFFSKQLIPNDNPINEMQATDVQKTLMNLYLKEKFSQITSLGSGS